MSPITLELFLNIGICFSICTIAVLPFIRTDLFLFKKPVVRTILTMILLWVVLRVELESYIKSLVIVLILMLTIKAQYE